MATTEKEHTTTTATTYPFDFPYLNVKDVQVELNGEKLTPIEDEDLNSNPTKPHKFTRQTTQIKLVDTPTAGNKLRIYRTTDDSGLTSTFYPGSAIRSHDLNDNFTQNLYATQENTKDADLALDNSRRWDATLDNGNGNWKSAFDKSADAVATANIADGKADDAVETADDAKDATDALVGVYNTTTNLWETRGHGSGSDPESGVGKALDDSSLALTTANAADAIADDALEATDALVGKKVNNVWVTRGHADNANGDPESGVGKALDDSAYAVSTADTAKDTYAIPASTAAEAAEAATTALVGVNTAAEGATPVWVTKGHGITGDTAEGVGKALDDSEDALEATDALVGKKVNNAWVTRGHGVLGDTEEGVGKALDNSTLSLNNSRRSNNATPPVYTSAISISEDAYDNAVRQSSDPNWSPSGGTESAIRIAEAAEVTADLAEGIANTASANATAAQNAVTNAELFTPYATVSDIPDNNVSSITVAPTAQGDGYTSTPVVTIGVEWTVATAYILNNEVFNGSNIYLVTTAGTSAAAPSNGPTGTGTSITDGTVTWEYKGPKATATAVVTDEKVTSITVTNKGNHYTGTPTVTIAAPPAATPPATAAQAYATAVMGPLNEETAEVADSTGLSVFTPLTDIPAGFGLGDSGLTVKLKYDTSTTPDTWKFISYFANDAEIRYWKKIVIENQIEIDRNYTIGDGNNAFGVGPVTIKDNNDPETPGYTLTIPENSTYLVL